MVEFAQTDTKMTLIHTSIRTLHARNSDKNIYTKREQRIEERKKNLHLTSAKQEKSLYTLQ